MTLDNKKKKKIKLPKIKELKKPIIVGGLITSVAIAGIIIGIIISTLNPKRGILNVGITYEVNWIDPLLFNTAAEKIIINQVTETLFENDYIGGTSQIINNLAINHSWNSNYTEFTCFLREGVSFHDGTPFNATAVKWNFDRVIQIIDPSNPFIISWGYLFFLPDGRWIINETQVINRYTVKFILNDRFVPFRDLLTHSATGILSPASTPANKTLQLQTDDIVGTGPFIYDGYNPNLNITLSPNQNYWGTKPNIDKMVLLFYPNSTTRIDDLWYGLLNKEIDMLDYNYFECYDRSIDLLKSYPGITVQEAPAPLNYRFIGMDNNMINTTMRKAISYAINYSQIDEINPNTIKSKSPIPEGILYSNTTGIDVPYYNISKARQILIDTGWPGTAGLTANDNVSSGNEWEKLVTNGTPLATYNLSYMPWMHYSEGMSRSFPDNLKQIGINVTRQFMFSTPYQIIALGWIYDYNDPHNAMLDYHSKWNMINLNDTMIDEWIENGVKETDPILREKIYYNIQKRFIEEIYPVIFAFSTLDFEVYVSNLKGLHLTPFKTLLKTIYFF